MLSDSERVRYSRQLLLPELGEEGQLKLQRASVLVVGAGGLGSPAAIYLAAAGVGRLGLVDFDAVDATNLHRQILYDSSDFGRSKLAAARRRLEAMNPEVDIVTHDVFLSSENAMGIVVGYDVVIDGSDNFPTRYLINDACILGKKLDVYGSVFRFEGQVTVFDAARGPCYRCLYPEPPPAGLVPNCAEAGVLGVLPGIIGSIQAAEAIKIVTGIGEPLIKRLLMLDAVTMSFREVGLPMEGHSHSEVETLIDYERFCNPMDINVKELSDRIARGEREFTLLDVREPHEWEAGHLDGALHIPLQQLPPRMAELPRDREIVVYCRMGGRSANARQFLTANGFANVRNLTGGMKAWKQEIDPTMTVV